MILEISLVVTAIAAIVVAWVAVVLVRRVLPLARALEDLVRDGNQVVRRLHDITDDVGHVAHDARRFERRVSGMVEPLLNQVEPPLRILNSVLAGVRVGVTSFLRGQGDGSRRNLEKEAKAQRETS